MASCFEKLLEGEILAINKAAVPANTKKAMEFGWSVFTGW